MANPVMKFIESVLFAGLKPSTPGQSSPPPAKSGPLVRLLARIGKLAYGAAPNDPLYLSNRTWQQKLRAGVVLGIPAVLLIAALTLVFGTILIPKAPPSAKPISAAEIAAKVLPNLEKTVNIEQYKDADMVEIGVDRAVTPPRLRGKLQNNTNRKLSVSFVVDLTDFDGTRVGAEAQQLTNVPPHESVLFDFPMKPTTATVALMREIHTIP